MPTIKQAGNREINSLPTCLQLRHLEVVSYCIFVQSHFTDPPSTDVALTDRPREDSARTGIGGGAHFCCQKTPDCGSQC